MALSRRSMAKYYAALGTLHTAMETIRSTKMGSTSLWKPCQAGLLIATTVVIHLQEVLLGNEGYDFFLTSRLLQDCLENLFSVVRLRKPVPSAYDMKCALRLVSVSQFLFTPRTTSYDLDDREYLVDLLSQAKKERTEVEADEINDSESLFIEELPTTECSILHYIRGFILIGILPSVADATSARSERTHGTSAPAIFDRGGGPTRLIPTILDLTGPGSQPARRETTPSPVGRFVDLFKRFSSHPP